jgi:hypothetical protein
MDMMQAAVFLAGSILTVLGFVVVVIGIVVVNNILHKYWKPITILRFEQYPPVFVDETRRQEPDLNNVTEKDKK